MNYYSQPFPQTDVSEYLRALKGSAKFGSWVVCHEAFKPRPARFAPGKISVPHEIKKALETQGVKRLYTHQAEAIDLIEKDKDVIVATPTASGKSLIYNLPVLKGILADPNLKALYLFPLKALARDQLRVIDTYYRGLSTGDHPLAAVFDGDTSGYFRKKLRDHPPRILISNPDMLHLSMLAYHDRWVRFWEHLKYVVIDEVHTYRGIFGSHMAWILRRLKRICSRYGAHPRFLLFSATIGNPQELAQGLIDREVIAVTETGAPTGKRNFVFFDPPDSAAHGAGQLLEAALKRGLRTIVYTQSRKMTELIALWTRSRLGNLQSKLSAYRAGFLPEERREIEQKLASGELLGVVSTSALELGIDIGNLDICILVGYPGSIMASRQRGGRVGRHQQESLVVMTAQEDALDRYFMRNPDDFFNRPIEPAVINPNNEKLMKRHLVCGAAEAPIQAAEAMMKIKSIQEAVMSLTQEGRLLMSRDGDRWFASRKYPHRQVNLRGTDRSYTIHKADDRTLLGEIDGFRCFKECHRGAIYLHKGDTWLVTDLDLADRQVRAVPKTVDYFTRAMGFKETKILKVDQTARQQNITASLGCMRVTDQVTGFKRKLVKGQKTVSVEPLDLPPRIFETEGLWVEIPDDLRLRIEQNKMHFMGGIHALEHAAIGMFPTLVLCDRNDVGGISYVHHPQLEKAAVFIYDSHPGGIGLAARAFRDIKRLLTTTAKVIRQCACRVGCPGCVHSPKCGSGNRPIDKQAALAVLNGLFEENTEHDDQAAGSRPGRLIRPIPPAGNDEKKKKFTLPKRYGVFDVETKRSASEVGGWHRAGDMGVSVAVLYLGEQDDYLVFRENEVSSLIDHLQQLDLVVGFNNKRFDNRVLSAYTDVDLYALPTLDILEAVTDRLGYRIGLDGLAEQTLGIKKSGNGLLALKWYQEGRIDRIIDYCKKDVAVTRDLLLFGLRRGYFIFKNKSGHAVRCPVQFNPSVKRPAAGR